MSNILITGAAGFIGFHLSKNLIKDYSLTLIDDFQNSNYAAIKRAELLKRVKKVNIQTPFIEKLNSTPEVLVHLAAETGIADSLTQPAKYFSTNVQGTFNVLEQCRKNNIKFLIYASSSSVYTKGQEITSEESNTDSPLSFYGTSKKMSEVMIENYCKQFGLVAIGLRFFTVYGSWTRPDMAGYKFMSAIHQNKPIYLYNNGEVYRDFTHVSDIIGAIKLLIPIIKHLKEGVHQIYNIGMGQPTSVKEYATLIAQNLGKEAIIKYKPLPSNELSTTHSDTTKLYNFINYKPKCTLKDGVKEMTDWFKTNRYD